jgi:DNA-binding NtrC family response regulator
MNESPPEVLIVEDEPLTRMAAVDSISELGLEVNEAGDAGEALRVLNARPEVGLLFTDIDLPGGVNGLVLAAQVHKERPDVELIVTSGHVRVADSDLPDSGTFLAKPYRHDRLQTVIADKLKLHQSR